MRPRLSSVLGACAAVAVLAFGRPAFAHGPPAAVTGVVASDATGVRVVSLTEGLGVRRASGWEWICPAAFGPELAPPAVSADGTRAFVVGQDDLYAIDEGGAVSAQHRPDLSRQRVLGCAVVGGRIYALRFATGGGADVVAFDGAAPIWHDPATYDAVTADGASLWVARTDGATGYATRLGADGAVLESHAFAVNAGDEIILVRRVAGTLFASVVTSSSTGALLAIDDANTASVVMTANAPFGGPVQAADGSAWVVAGGLLRAIAGGTANATATAATCVGASDQAGAYVCSPTRVAKLGAAGAGDALFSLGDLRGPADEGAGDAGAACGAEWAVFQYDLGRAGIVLDAGAAPADPPAGGGCAVGRAPGTGSPLAALVLAIAARRRRRAT